MFIPVAGDISPPPNSAWRRLTGLEKKKKKKAERNRRGTAAGRSQGFFLALLMLSDLLAEISR